MRSIAAFGVLVLLFASSASPKEAPEVKQLLEQIAGKEKLPARQVFKNVKLLGHVPAERLLRIMDIGYSQSLGVSCDYCHVEDRWDADEKRQKRAAREMIQLTGRINEQLGQMEEIDPGDATVNCTTCHRGDTKPALSLK